jgi:U3 small nucleolar RNA-associated protein 14
MQERMSLKHKNTSKWARQQLKMGTKHLDQSARRAMGEQLRIGDELRRKAERADSDGDSEGDSDDDGDYDSLTASQALVLDAPVQVVTDGGLLRAVKLTAPAKGMAGMKFMQRAAQRNIDAAREEAVALLANLSKEELLSGESDDGSGDVEGGQDEATTRLSETETGSALLSAPPMFGSSLEVLRLSQGKRTRVDGAITTEEGASPEANPWLEASRPMKQTKSVHKEQAVAVLNLAAATAAALLDRAPELTLPLGRAEISKAEGSALIELSQTALVRRAFAAPNVTDEFLEEKRISEHGKSVVQAAESDGWGSWAGAGALPTKRSRDIPTASQKHPHVSASKRADRHLPLVVMTEKRIKKASRLKVDEIPYPFTSREQYERSLAVPVGKEWNAMRAARGFARPAVITDAGKAMAPIKIPKRRPFAP